MLNFDNYLSQKFNLFFMKIILIFIIFLLLVPMVMAQKIIIPNITIRIPNINQTRFYNLTVLNQTRVSEIIKVLGVNFYDLLKERLNRVVDYVLNRIAENIANSIPHIIEILLKGNTTN